MTVKDIVETIGEENVPVCYHTDKKREMLFSTILFTKEEFESLGKHRVTNKGPCIILLNSTIEEVYDAHIKQQQNSVKAIEDIIKEAYYVTPEDNMKYLVVLFMVLHEFGHWHHYRDGQFSAREYRDRFLLAKCSLEEKYKRYVCSCPSQHKEIYTQFAKKYRELPVEAYADNYALVNMLKFWKLGE